MAMKLNPFMAARAKGEVQLGTYINTERNPAVLAILKQAGLHFARIDMEHSSYSAETIADMALYSRAIDFPIAVRPPSANREWVGRLLDFGVWGLQCAGIDTPELAAEVVSAARYVPLGKRGMSVAGPHNEFTAETDRALMNEQIHITAMLESELAFSNIDEIAATPGIDTIALGPNDLAHDLGIFANPDREKVIDEYRMRMIDAAKRHGKDVAMTCGSAENAQRWIDAGVRIIVLSQDKVVLQRGYKQMVDALKLG